MTDDIKKILRATAIELSVSMDVAEYKLLVLGQLLRKKQGVPRHEF